MRITILRCSATLALLAGACSVFDPPELGTGNDAGGSGGSKQTGAGGHEPDASLNESGRASSGGAANVSSGGATGTRDASLDAEPHLDGAVDSGDAIPSAGGAPPVGPWWNTTNADGCEVARAPKSTDRPAFSDPGADLPPIYFAQSRARYGSAADDQALTPDETAWSKIGFDLDGVCSNSETCGPEGGRINKTSCKSLATYTDGDNCRDNVIGQIYHVAATSPILGGAFGFTEQDWNCEFYRGGFSLIYKLSNYNGQKNDASVRLDVYSSTGLQQLPGWACRADITQPLRTDWYKFAPWLSTAHWKISKRSIDLAATPDGNQVPNSNVFDAAAFVRGGYLFAKLPEASESWLDGENTPVPGIRLVMRHPFLVAQVVKNGDGSWGLKHGTLSMIILPGDLLTSYKEMGFCDNMCASFNTIRSYLNASADVLVSTDEILPDVPCDGLSAAFDFEARQATATASDVADVAPPVECPQPRNPTVPRQGCVCQANGTCILPADGGN